MSLESYWSAIRRNGLLVDTNLLTVPDVLAEVSNLIDLSGEEGQRARRVFKEVFLPLEEVAIPSRAAAEDPRFDRLGLTDAAIGSVVRTQGCAVLTDDLELYLSLSRDGHLAFNFAHVQAYAWGM